MTRRTYPAPATEQPVTTGPVSPLAHGYCRTCHPVIVPGAESLCGYKTTTSGHRGIAGTKAQICIVCQDLRVVDCARCGCKP